MKPQLLLLEEVLVCMTLLAFIGGFIALQPPAGSARDSPEQHERRCGTAVKKVVVMIIDGLRSDHVLSGVVGHDGGAATLSFHHDLMPYVAGQLQRTQGLGRGRGAAGQKQGTGGQGGGALAFEMHTALPTVTAPRIMSLVTGGVPGFLSVASNFGTSRLTQDNIMQRWHDAGRRIRLYGDETWLRIFPGLFDVADPVTSFFVTDHTEVDLNVSRHLDELTKAGSAAAGQQDSEQKHRDGSRGRGLEAWDVVVLHYLGLDHIGHTHGHNNTRIRNKLRQMDEVVRKLHTALQAGGEEFLMLVCGDHGMADGGGHGGASIAEVTTAALVFSSSDLRRSPKEGFVIRQVDLASTLGAVTGVGVPRGGVGAALEQVVRAVLNPQELLEFHRAEARRLVDMLRAAGLPAGDVVALLAEAEWVEAQHEKEVYQIDQYFVHCGRINENNDADGKTNDNTKLNDVDNKVALNTESGIHAANNDVDNKQSDNTGNNTHKFIPVPALLSPESAAVAAQLTALYQRAATTASNLLLLRLQAYDLPLLATAAAVIATMAVCRVVLTLRASYHGWTAPDSRSMTAYTVVTAAAVVVVTWTMFCGSTTSNTQLCRPASAPTPLLQLLPPGLYCLAMLGCTVRLLSKDITRGRARWVPDWFWRLTWRVGGRGRWWAGGGLVRVLLAAGSVGHSLSLLGTSFVEEEHQTFYFLHTSSQACLLLLAATAAVTVMAAPGRKCRSQGKAGQYGVMAEDGYEAELLRRNQQIRRNMKDAYNQFGLNESITRMEIDIDGVDNNLANVIDKSSKQEKYIEECRRKKQHLLILTCLALLVSMTLFRISRNWNSTGDKWKHLPDIGDFVRGLDTTLQKAILVIAMLLFFGTSEVCPLYVMMACCSIYGRHYPFDFYYKGLVEILMCYLACGCIFVWGLIRNRLLNYIFVKIGHKDHNLDYILIMLGVMKLQLLNKKRTSVLPTTEHTQKITLVPVLSFEHLQEKYSSSEFLVSDLLTYIYAAVAVVWLLLQRPENLLVCVLLLVQTKLLMHAVMWMVECGVAGVVEAGAEEDRKVISAIMALPVMWMAQAFFFVQGNSNSLATVDVAAGFVGVWWFSPGLHGLLIAIHTFGAPLLVYLQYLALCLRARTPVPSEDGHAPRRSRGWWAATAPVLQVWWCGRVCCAGVYAIHAVVQRDHLFVWSVHAPKIIYEAAHLATLVVVSGVLYMAALIGR